MLDGYYSPIISAVQYTVGPPSISWLVTQGDSLVNQLSQWQASSFDHTYLRRYNLPICWLLACLIYRDCNRIMNQALKTEV